MDTKKDIEMMDLGFCPTDNQFEQTDIKPLMEVLTTEQAMANIEQGFKERAERNAKLAEENVDTEENLDVYGKLLTDKQAKSYYAEYPGEPSIPMTGEQINAELDALVAKSNNLPTPSVLWSFGFEADDVLAVYAALRTYLRILAGQESEDLEMLARIVKLMTQIRPGAVKASKALSLVAVGDKNAK